MVVLFSSSCQEKLKEHPLPESLKQKIIKQNDPTLKAKEISGTITVDEKYASSIPKNAVQHLIRRGVFVFEKIESPRCRGLKGFLLGTRKIQLIGFSK